MSELVQKLLRQLTQRPAPVVIGTVTEVDANGGTCDVEPHDGGAPLVNVRLRSVLDGGTDGLLILPAMGSDVVLLLLDADTALVVQYGAVAWYSIRTQNESLKALLKDLLAAIGRLTVTTSAGPSGVPINFSEFQALGARLDNLLKD